jgi:recombination protein RecT
MASGLAQRAQAARSGAGSVSLKQRVASTRELLDQLAPEFAKALPSHISPQLFIRVTLTVVQQKPALLDCTPESFLGALMSCASLGLMPGTKEAALVPFGRTCTLIPQWQGLVRMMFNSGQVDSVIAEFIHEHDEWAYVPSRRPPDDFYHAPAKKDRGEVTHAYAFAWLANGSRSRVAMLDQDEAVYIRNRFSRAYALAESNGRKDSPWHTDFPMMWRKSAVRRIADWVPTSAEMRYYLAAEQHDGEVSSTYAPPQREVPPEVAGELEAAVQADDSVTLALSLVDEHFAALKYPEKMRLLADFTGHEVKMLSDLTTSDACDIVDAFRTAAAGGTRNLDETAAAFKDLAAMGAAAEVT